MTLKTFSPSHLEDELSKREPPSLDLSGLMETADAAPQQVIVKLNPNADAGAIATLKSSLGAVTVETTQSFGFELWEMADPISEEALQAIADLSLLETVDYLQPNYTLSVQNTSFQDPGLSQLWGLNNEGQQGGTPDADIDAPEAWEISTGEGVVVAVIDSGVDYTHPDLAANLWVNPGEIANNGIDDDGNGYVDDVHGYDFANNDGDPMDGNGHGTHVAGTIAAVGNNGQGIVGVAPDAQIMALKFLSDNGSGSTFDAIQAIEYAVLMGADITNNSWGGGAFSQALGDAIATAGAAGQLFVAAAGNSSNNNDMFMSFPASYSLDSVISVAASTRRDQLASFSNFGQTTVDLAAPGSSIFSTLPGGQYGNLNGTSMAAPHVAGVAALVWAADPSLTALEVKQRILDSVDPLPTLAGKTLTGGRLNAFAALDSSAPDPEEPVQPPFPLRPQPPDWWRRLFTSEPLPTWEPAPQAGDKLLGDRSGVLTTQALTDGGLAMTGPSDDWLIDHQQAIATQGHGAPVAAPLLTEFAITQSLITATSWFVGSAYRDGDEIAQRLVTPPTAGMDKAFSLAPGSALSEEAIAHLVDGLQI